MTLSRRALLVGLAGGAATLSLKGRAGASFELERFAASREEISKQHFSR